TSLGRDPTLAVVTELRKRAPVLIMVDDFQPNPGFAKWFVDVFVSALRRHEAIIVAVGVRDDFLAATGLEAAADEVIRIGPLERQLVVDYFRRFGATLTKPLSQEEVSAYS